MKNKNAKYSIFLLLLTVSHLANAQDSLPKKTEQEATVTAFRFPENKLKVPFTTLSIKNNGWNMNTPNTADVLQNSGSINVQKSQAGGGSPIIRGFEASRILLMVDGVRMNNAIYRSGHLQNIITVDANSLDKIDVVFGPSSTQFGSDALGGVINMQTKTPQLSTTYKPLFTGTINNRYSSAMNEMQSHIDINIGTNKIGFFTSLTYTNISDVMQGKKRKAAYNDFGKLPFYVQTLNNNDYVIANPNVNKQINSGYTQNDFVQKILYQQNKNVKHIANFQYSISSNINRYDRLSEITTTRLPKFAQWYYGPQKRLMASYNYEQVFNKPFLKKIQSTVAYQNIEESRVDRNFNSKTRNNRIEQVGILSTTTDALYKKANTETHIGIDLQFNNVHSEAYSTNITTLLNSYNINSRYPNGKNKMNTIAAYLQQIKTIKSNITFTYGARITNTNLTSTVKDNTIAQLPFTQLQQNNSAVVGNMGITYITTNNWKLSAAASNGFRAPNFDELKIFESKPGSLLVPNENIKPEYSYNAEVNATKYAGAFQCNAALFYTYLRNAIQVSNYTYKGSSTILYQGVVSNVLAAQNTSNGYLYGLSTNVKYTITPNTIVEGAYTYTYGCIKNAGVLQPLDHVSPTYGKVSIKHKQKIWNAELFSLFNGAKKLNDYSNSGEDNFQYATPTGMPSWYTINLHTQVALQKKLSLNIGIENILDKNYRVFASGISAPGINFIVSCKASF
jgi:hemoglobin/transferrin/lactoferrin receptor protein